ncbi:MAG: S8 family serine peptidase [Nitrospinae bacterium]|nr:S8 family serine peptidase [Nitrospinota bacterium]
MSGWLKGGRGACAAFTLNRTSVCAILLFAMLVLTNCGGGGGGSRVIPAVMPETEQPQQPPQEPVQPPQPPQPQQPQPECIPLYDGTCSSISDFNSRAGRLAGEYRLETPFRNQWGLEVVGADRAYAHVNLLKGESAGAGAGVTIGFIDSGIDTTHGMFAGKTVHEVFLGGTPNERGTTFSHGTAVASVAAGNRTYNNPAAPQGVAWDADIAMFAIPVGIPDDTYNPVSLADSAGVNTSWASRFNRILAWRNGRKRVDILNLSIGYEGIIDDYGETDLRASFADAIAAMAQAGAAGKAIFVWAAGNAHGRQCDPSVMTSNCVGGGADPLSTGTVDAVSVDVFPGLAVRIAELRGHTVAVVALGRDRRIADFSNRCGIAADYCIAAPGGDVKVAYFGPHPDTSRPIRGIGRSSGTSVAAPMVAGGLAIMKQLFRDQLSNTELVTRLLETADNTGAYSNRAVYGRGKLDLAAATHPVGALEVPVAANTNGSGSNLRATRLSLGAPFGSGLARSVANIEIMALDDLGAPFWYRLGDFVTAANGPPMDARVRGFLAGGTREAPEWRGVSAQKTSTETGGGHLSLAEGGMMTTLKGRAGLSASVFGTNREHDAVGATLGWRPEGSPLGLRLGWITEDETILGGEGQGAFGALAADTAFIRLEGDVKLGAWRLGGGAEWGSVRTRAQGGLIEEISTISTSAFALHARAAVTAEDTVRFSLSQPLRVEDGRASLTVPAARTKLGRVVHTSMTSPLAPDERQIDLAATWERPLAEGRLRIGVVWSRNPGHRGDAVAQLTFLAGWRRAF